MKNWKTTLTGLLVGAYPFIDGLYNAYVNGFFKDRTTPVEVLFGAAIIIMGMVSKDHDVTGKVLIPVLICIGSIAASAQTIDTTNGVSFQGPTLFYCTNVNHAPTTSLVAAVGIQYRHTGIAADWSVAGQFGQGGSLAPNLINGVTVIGLTGSVKRLGNVSLPVRLTLGIGYSFQTRTGLYMYGGGLPVGIN